jgi:hypothetical protein
MIQILNAEGGRVLESTPWVANTVRTVKLPQDVALKRLSCRLSGSFKVEYAAGAPVFDVYGIFNQLVPNVQVVLDGKDVVKSLSPFEAQQLQYIMTGILGEQRYSTSAAAFTTAIGLTDGRPGAYPATTQYVLDNETISLFFENPWAYGYGADLSILNLQMYSNPELRFQFASYGAMQNPASSSVSVTYTADIALSIETSTIEAQDVNRGDQFLQFREYTLSETFSSRQTGFVMRLNTGNHIQGVMFVVRNGDTTKTLSDKALTRIQFRLNGQQVVKDTTFLQLQAENLSRRGILATTSSSVRRIDGCAYMSLIKNGDVRTAIDLSLEARVSTAQLILDTAASSGNDAATYTAGVDVNAVIQEIVGMPKGPSQAA